MLTDSSGFYAVDKQGKYSISINSKLILQLLQYCEKADDKETGGILIGFYNDSLDCALVTRVIDAPIDSKRGRTWFQRGMMDLQSLINKLWSEQKHYYLGEWHYHPLVVPVPSRIDIEQMREIAISQPYQCPEPLLLIVGGSSASWMFDATVIPRSEKNPVKLISSADSLSKTRITKL